MYQTQECCWNWVEGKKVLHVGDAMPVKDNYINTNLIEENIDLLIVPFPYIGLSKAREVIEQHIRTERIAIVHLPYKHLDSFGWINAATKSYSRVEKEFVKTVFLEDPGQYIHI